MFDEIVHTVNPETGHAVTFLPGEAKPQFVIEQELAAQSKPAPDTTPAPRAGKRSVKAATDTA